MNLLQTSGAVPKDTSPRERRSLRRFLGYASKYRLLIGLAAAAGIVRYLIPLVLPWVIKILVDQYLHPLAPQSEIELHMLMLGLVGLYVIYALSSYYRSYLSGLAGHKIIFDLREALYLHLQRMSLSFFDRQRVGEVVNRITGDIAAAQNFVGQALISATMDLSCVGVIIILILAAHWKLALVSLSVIPCFGFTNYFLIKRIKAKSRDIHDKLQVMSGELHEQFSAISTIQAFTQEENEAQEFRQQNEEYLDSILSNVKLQSIALALTSFLTAIGPLIVLWYGTVEVWAGQLTVGTLMAFYAYLGLLYQPVQRLTELNVILTNSLAAMDRIFEMFDTYPEIQEKRNPLNIVRSRGEIAFEQIGFKYNGGLAVLSEFDLRIPAGKSVAFVGPSGAGKSTILKLLLRFYDVTSGRIAIDGTDIRDIGLKSLRQQIAFVAQDPILLSGTIMENLRYGKPDATPDQIRAAAHAAFADHFIDRLPLGYETPIGERGIRLSGGEKQRLALARAFLKDAPILILDEPTSALDADSEELIKQALRQLLKGRTSLVIAHRLSTLEFVDEITVVEEGRILERGTHEELLKKSGSLYRRYAEQQLTLDFERQSPRG
ncbi:MAG: ABC transporter ATP-binding protein [Candidatus Omnitrophica bacterium]|nr:ABC transporter ATP-binding protein [Candidatus Omnitrophota bacterium]